MRALILAFVLAGCASSARLDSGAVIVEDTLVVDATAWNRFEAPGTKGGEFWTIDGIALDRLRFFVAIAEGEALGEPLGKRPLPAFRASLTPHEIVELYEAFTTEDASAFRLLRLSPARFVGREAFRFEFELTRRLDDLELAGMGYGAVVEGRLYLMVYSAPKLHYFEKHLAAAEWAINSARVQELRSR